MEFWKALALTEVRNDALALLLFVKLYVTIIAGLPWKSVAVFAVTISTSYLPLTVPLFFCLGCSVAGIDVGSDTESVVVCWFDVVLCVFAVWLFTQEHNDKVKIIENNKIVFFIIKSFLFICIFAANDGLHPASPFRQYFHILKNAWYKILYHA